MTAQELTLRRQAANLTQTELSKRTGIAQPDISALESGKRHMFAGWARRLEEVI